MRKKQDLRAAGRDIKYKISDKENRNVVTLMQHKKNFLFNIETLVYQLESDLLFGTESMLLGHVYLPDICVSLTDSLQQQIPSTRKLNTRY